MGYLYAAVMSIPGYPFTPVKVGFTNDPNKRQSAYIAGPFPVKWIGFWEGTREEERDFHERFAGQRLTGEWFIPSKDFMDEVEGAIAMYDMRESLGALVEEHEAYDGTNRLEVLDRIFGGIRPAP